MQYGSNCAAKRPKRWEEMSIECLGIPSVMKTGYVRSVQNMTAINVSGGYMSQWASLNTNELTQNTHEVDVGVRGLNILVFGHVTGV